MMFDQFSFTSLFTMLSATYTRNKISTATSILPGSQQFSTLLNVDRDLNLTLFASFSQPIRKLKIKYSVRPRITYANGIVLLSDSVSRPRRI